MYILQSKKLKTLQILLKMILTSILSLNSQAYSL